MVKFKVSYVTTLPKEGNAPRVSISGKTPHKYQVEFHEKNYGLILSGICYTNQTIIAKGKQWYTEWIIKIKNDKGVLVYEEEFNPSNKVVFIKLDAYALGDSIAWIPYIEEFRIKHGCTVICSTFHNNLFVDDYPNILFVAPNTTINNVYAQYYIGAIDTDDIIYSPIKSTDNPLQKVATSILGLPFNEFNPNLKELVGRSKAKIEGDYITLSEFGSADYKQWTTIGGWQSVVDYLKSIGYKVVVISKEPTNLTGIIDLTGNLPLIDRAIDIYHAKAHLGVSSGLSWLAWAVGTHVVMISDVTPIWHEFGSNITRLGDDDLNCVNYSSGYQTKVNEVIEKLGELLI